MSRIALYWHNGRSLGHTKRSFNIGNAIIRQFPDYAVMGITGAFRGLEQSPEGMDIVKLPSHRTYETLDGHYSKPLLKIPQNTLKELRESLISTFVKKFKPETMLVDYLPLGKNRELILIFEDKLIPKKFLGFRGIMDLPERTNYQNVLIQIFLIRKPQILLSIITTLFLCIPIQTCSDGRIL